MGFPLLRDSYGRHSRAEQSHEHVERRPARLQALFPLQSGYLGRLLRRDAVWFAQKDQESSTVYYSLSDFKGARGKIPTSRRYMQGAFGALPITSEFYFVHDGTPVEPEKSEEEAND